MILCPGIAGDREYSLGPEEANLKAAKIQVEAFDVALQNYQLDTGSFPLDAAGLRPCEISPADLPDPTKWKGPYLGKDVPLDPWNKPYQYHYPGQHNTEEPTFRP